MSEDWKKIWYRSPITLMPILIVIFFSDTLFNGKVLYGADFINYFYPVKKFIRDYFLAHGSLPLWNPYLFSGAPFITNIQASMFYPLGFLYYLIEPEMAYVYSTILHYLLGSLFMYALMRTLSVSRIGSVFSAFIFMFNGYFSAHIYAGHLSFVQNYIWIPLIFCFIYKFVHKNHYSYVLIAGVVLGIQILGGFPQIAFYTMFAMALYFLFNLFINPTSQNDKKGFQLVSGLFIVLLAGFSLAAVQILPTYEFTQLSTRAGGVSYEFATYDSFPLKHFLTFLIPYLYGSVISKTFWISNISWQFWEFCCYMGIGTLVLIFGNIRRMVADRDSLFFILLLCISLFLAIGKYNPLYRFIYHLPGFNDFRIPAQILFLSTFSLAVLAGKGLDYLQEEGLSRRPYRTFIFIVLTVLVLVTVWLYSPAEDFFYVLFNYFRPTGITKTLIGQIHSIVESAVLRSYLFFLSIVVALYLYEKRRISSILIRLLIVVIGAADLWLFSSEMIKEIDLGTIRGNGSNFEYIRKDKEIGRTVISEDCFVTNAGLWYGFQDIRGYDPLILKRYIEYINRSQNISLDNHVVNLYSLKDFDNPLIDMLNVKYLVDCRSKTILKRKKYVPRAYVVYRMVIKDRSDILDYMMDDEFDPLKLVVLERLPEEPFLPPNVEAEQRGKARILFYKNKEILVEATLNRPGFLVMSEINYPGWEASVDGQPQEILTGDYLFRTVPLKAGTHTVRFLFKPVSFKLGALISSASLITIILGLVLLRRRRISGEGSLE